MISTEKIMDKIFDNEFLKGLDGASSHFQKHISATLSDDIDRIFCEEIQFPRGISHFSKPDGYENTKKEPGTNFEFAEEIIGDAVLDSLNKDEEAGRATIFEDLENNKKDNRKKAYKIFSPDKYAGVGVVFDKKNGTLKEFKTKEIKLILRRTVFSHEGFEVVTAYPNIDMYESKAVETNRSIHKDVLMSNTFQKGNGLMKTYMFTLIDGKNIKPMPPYLRKNSKGNLNVDILRYKIPIRGDVEHIHFIEITENKCLYYVENEDKKLCLNPLSKFAQNYHGNPRIINLLDEKMMEKFNKTFPIFSKNSSINEIISLFPDKFKIKNNNTLQKDNKSNELNKNQ